MAESIPSGVVQTETQRPQNYTPLSSPELAPQPATPETLFQKRYCIYFSGATGGKHTAEPIGHALETVFGQGNVETVSSSVSIDKHDPTEKYSKLADSIINQSKQVDRIALVAMSGGPLELADVANILKHRGLPENEIKRIMSKLDIVLVAPAGVCKGVEQTSKFNSHLKDYIKAFFGGGPDQGFQSLYLYPPSLTGEQIQRLSSIAQEFLPESAKFAEHDKELQAQLHSTPLPKSIFPEFQPQIKELEDKMSRKGKDLKTETAKIDKQIADALQLPDRIQRNEKLKKLLAERGKLFIDPLQKTYDKLPIFPLALVGVPTMVQAGLGLLHMKHQVETGEVMTTYEWMRDQGVTFKFVSPQLDKVSPVGDPMTRENIIKLAGKDALTQALIMLELSTHEGWVVNPQALADAVATLLNINKTPVKST